eukprot:jgi/Botrbrau1/21592/Bobra.43_1s0002.1
MTPFKSRYAVLALRKLLKGHDRLEEVECLHFRLCMASPAGTGMSSCSIRSPGARSGHGNFRREVPVPVDYRCAVNDGSFMGPGWEEAHPGRNPGDRTGPVKQDLLYRVRVGERRAGRDRVRTRMG